MALLAGNGRVATILHFTGVWVTACYAARPKQTVEKTNLGSSKDRHHNEPGVFYSISYRRKILKLLLAILLDKGPSAVYVGVISSI